MELSSIVPAIIAFLTAFLLPLFLSKRKKEGHKKFDEFRNYLLGLGLKLVELDKESEPVKLGKKFSLGQKSEGGVALEDRNIDFILVISVASQYGVNYFIEYLVRRNFNLRERPMKRTRLGIKKSSIFGGKVVDVTWKGDEFLTQRLNMDYELKHKLLQADLNKFKGSISIIPAPKHGYIRIKTNYNLPSYGIFDAIDSVARYVKE